MSVSSPINIQVANLPVHNPDNFGFRDRGNFQNSGANQEASFNLDLINKSYNMMANPSQLDPLEQVGVEHGIQVDTFDFAQYLGFLSAQFVNNAGFYGDLIKKNGADSNGSGNVFSMGELSPIGHRLEYIPVNNGDQTRLFGTRIFDTESQAAYKFRVTQTMIDDYNLANNTTLSYIPASAQELTVGPDASTGYNNNPFAPISDSCFSCSSGSCGSGKRLLYVQKMNQTVPNALTCKGVVAETIMIMETVRNGNKLVMKVRRGVNGTTTTAANGATNTNGMDFQFGSTKLEVGDMIFVGTIARTTECNPADMACPTFEPKIYKFCDTIREFEDCCVCMSRTGFNTARFGELFNYAQVIQYSTFKNLRNFYHRVNNDLFLGSPNYAQGYPMPSYNGMPGSKQEIIPYNTNGIFNLHNTHSKKMDIPLSSCNDQCSAVVIDTILNAVNRSSGGMYSREINTDSGYLLVGDVAKFDQIFTSGMSQSFLPVNLQGAIDQQSMQRRSWSMTSKSIMSMVDSGMQDQVTDNQAAMGLEFYEVKIGGLTFRALEDYSMKQINPGQMDLYHVPSIKLFTDSVDEITQKAMGSNPWLPATAAKGMAIPSVYSESYQTAMLNGKEVTLSKNNCPVSYRFYMRMGVRFAPAKLPYLWSFRLSSLQPNPLAGTLGEPTHIRGSINDLNCPGCIGVEEKTQRFLEQYSYAPNGNQVFVI
jgi:hypothetical protein